MKRQIRRWIAVVLLLGLWPAASAVAEDAPVLIGECRVKVSRTEKGSEKSITDGSYKTFWESKEGKNAWVTIESPEPLYGLYLCFQKMPEHYRIQKGNGGNWTDLAEGDTRFYHVFYALDGETSLRILAEPEGKDTVCMGFNEVFVFGEGEIPGWVQRWDLPLEKADILFLATHPDDDVLFLGSAIVTYAGELKKQVQVAYMTYSNTTRRSEALNGLWTMGVRTYPVFIGIKDIWSNSMEEAYRYVKGGQDALWRSLTELFRKCRPDVVVTHDLDGEYGHMQHRMTARAVADCFEMAADPEQYPESAAEYGPWTVSKVYLHLYGDESNQTRFHWDVPLKSMDGKTADEVAAEAYKMHVTQQGSGQKIRGIWHDFSVEEFGGRLYPNTCFGLYFSRVGDDVTHEDFLENLPSSAAMPAGRE